MAYNGKSKSLVIDFGVQFPHFRANQESDSMPECYEDVCCLAVPAETARELAHLIETALADEANDE